MKATITLDLTVDGDYDQTKHQEELLRLMNNHLSLIGGYDLDPDIEEGPMIWIDSYEIELEEG